MAAKSLWVLVASPAWAEGDGDGIIEKEEEGERQMGERKKEFTKIK